MRLLGALDFHVQMFQIKFYSRNISDDNATQSKVLRDKKTQKKCGGCSIRDEVAYTKCVSVCKGLFIFSAPLLHSTKIKNYKMTYETLGMLYIRRSPKLATRRLQIFRHSDSI